MSDKHYCDVGDAGSCIPTYYPCLKHTGIKTLTQTILKKIFHVSTLWSGTKYYKLKSIHDVDV
jgi:hypothetical protein